MFKLIKDSDVKFDQKIVLTENCKDLIEKVKI